MLIGKKVVVTGGAGFIGSHLVDALVEAGNDVIVIDNLSTGSLKNIAHHMETGNPSSVILEERSDEESQGGADPESGTYNLKLKTHNSRFSFVLGTITDLPLLQNLFQGVDYVFHEAAIPSVPRSIDNPAASHEANVTGTLNVLIAARDNQVKKVVYASSSAVYGDTPTLPKQEDMLPNPLSPYAVNKLAAEYYCRVFSSVYDLPTACLRYFNVYGPRQDPDSQYAAVIPKFIRSIRHGQSPTIFGDGEQSRDFTFVQDVVAANLLAAEGAATGVFNIGRGERTTLNELTRMILKLMIEPVNSALETRNSVLETRNSVLETGNWKLVHEKERVGDIKHSLADIARARTFGYNPQYTIEKGLIETISSLRTSLRAEP